MLYAESVHDKRFFLREKAVSTREEGAPHALFLRATTCEKILDLMDARNAELPTSR
jgi:hypothetical protein